MSTSSFAALVKAADANAFKDPVAPTPADTNTKSAIATPLSEFEEHDLAADAAHTILPSLQDRVAHLGFLDLCTVDDVARFIYDELVVKSRPRFFTGIA
jgi:hypothetical protein